MIDKKWNLLNDLNLLTGNKNVESVRRFVDNLVVDNLLTFEDVYIPFVDEFELGIDWNEFSRYYGLGHYLARYYSDKYKERINWEICVKEIDYVNREILAEDKEIEELYYRLHNFNEQEIYYGKDRLNWKLLSKYYKFTEHDLILYKDKLDWELTLKYQNLSLNFIEAYESGDLKNYSMSNMPVNVSEKLFDKFINKADKVWEEEEMRYIFIDVTDYTVEELKEMVDINYRCLLYMNYIPDEIQVYALDDHCEYSVELCQEIFCNIYDNLLEGLCDEASFMLVEDHPTSIELFENPPEVLQLCAIRQNPETILLIDNATIDAKKLALKIAKNGTNVDRQKMDANNIFELLQDTCDLEQEVIEFWETLCNVS